MNNKYRWSNKDTSTLKAWFVITIILISFEDYILKFFNNEIISVTSQVEKSSIPFVLILISSIAYCVFKIWRWNTYKFFTPYRYLISLGYLVITYIYYNWITKKYVTFPIYYGFGVSDIIITTLALIILFRIYLNIYLVHTSISNKNELSLDYYEDFPIRTQSDDLLKLEQKVKQVKLRIDNLDMKSYGSTSIGIIGKWGQGKSSFLFLLKEKYEKTNNENIIVTFNPRYSKDLKSIQFDFFELLISKLERYNIALSNTFKEYLNAIKVIDKTRVLETISNSPIFLDKELTKDNLNSELKEIGKRIIVFIDDLDRLQAEEIIEIFKILDYTASFSNIVFITAYDKDYVNGILDARYHKAENYFSDKFFNKEIFLPPVNKDIVYNYLYKKVEQSFDQGTDEFAKIKNTLYICQNIIHKVFFTLRDVKRFLNIFSYRYHKLKHYLDFNDLFLLYILKSKWYDFYLFLYREYFNIYDKWIVKNKGTLESEILEKYFTLDTDDSNALKKHKDLIESILERINFLKTSTNGQKILFENYFQEYEEDNDYKLTYEYMKRFVNKEFSTIKSDIDWYFDEDKYNELCMFVGHRDLNNITSRSHLENYLELLFYINARSDNEQGTYFQLLKFFNKEDEILKSFKQSNEISDGDYKSLLLDKLYIDYPHYPIRFIRNLISKLFPSEQSEGEIVINGVVENQEILELSKKYFEDYLKENPVFKKGHLDILYVCIEDIKKDYNRNIKLDGEICAKVEKLIKQAPSEYFNMLLSYQHDEVFIEPFYDQIFKSNSYFESFIMDKQYDNIEHINLVRNYWKLYKYNEYKSVSFNGFGSTKQKIDNEFRNEIKQLKQILKLKKEFDEIEESLKDLLDEMDNKNVTLLRRSNFKLLYLSNKTSTTKLLKSLPKIQDLIIKANEKDSNGNNLYWLDIEILKNLKHYDIRKLKLDGPNRIPDLIEIIEDFIKEQIAEYLPKYDDINSKCYEKLEPSLSRYDNSSFDINHHYISIDTENNSFKFLNGEFEVRGWLDSDTNDKPITVKANVDGSGYYKLDEDGNVDEIHGLNINNPLQWK